ncbi:hypothetical protein EYC80_003409 [Monilinia laxa]|uniref:Alpha-L-rhamnosidase six-hairpin glycosidase domain-containing protein n=1 Tax=Monilinia laxa TaxID=61186 RepID=A0A5N6KDU9_MONLA|nr:hypothetical protein EYC80_003409 [Monilinia laxa]
MTSSPFLTEEAKWIWVPDFDDTIDPGQFVLFRKSFTLEKKPDVETLLRVSADTRYRLFLNGKRISFGPCKSYPTRWYYETVDITPFLQVGRNVLSARVLRFSIINTAGTSMARTPLPGLILWCQIGEQRLHTNSSWKTIKDQETALVSSSKWDLRLGPPFLNLNEEVNVGHELYGWQEIDYDDTFWKNAEIKTMKRMMSPMLDARKLTPRTIPHLPEISRRFDNVVTCSNNSSLEDWKMLLQNDKPVELEAGTNSIVEIESSTLTTGFLEFSFEVKGSESDVPKIEILCAESYENDMDAGQPRTKADRTNFKTGKLYGPTDTYVCNSTQTKWYYEPFWWRTFRYIRISVTCPPSTSLTFNSITYRSTNYPLPITTTLNSTPLIDKLYSTSVNTLLNCMHETHEDCPYYEQNQFSMDTRSQLLFSYTISHSDLLARKTIHEFYASRRDDGLLETHFPNPGRSMNIPQFSLYWIFMVHDHLSHFSDIKFIKKYLGTIDEILDHFNNHMNEIGLVGQFEGEGTWPFVDWVKDWFTPANGFSSMGVPKAYYEKGAATINSLVYVMALNSAAVLSGAVGRNDTANEYRDRASVLIRAVNAHCFDSNKGLYLDGPSAFEQASQHVQIFAVLADVIKGDAAKDLMRKTIREREALRLVKASFAMSFYMFRAVEKAGIYEEVWEELLEPWKKMLDQNLTTWAESESMVRSDCHGWSASPMYEIVREIVGIKYSPIEDREGSLITTIKPRFDLVKRLEGKFVVSDGESIDVSWDDLGLIKLKSSKDMQIRLGLLGNTSEVKLTKGLEQSFQGRN